MARDRSDDRDDRDDRGDDRPRRDDRDDDRPRRARGDDDRPRRRRDRDDDTPPKKDVSVLGIFGLIASIVALLMSFIPFLGMFACIPGGIALLKSGIALLIAKLSQGRVGTGIPLTGTILSGVAILISIAQIVIIVLVAKNMPPPPTTSLSTPADVTITAEQLDREYDQNEFAADAKYKGKLIDVTGSVHKVSDGVKKFRLTVELTGIDGSTVDCDFRTGQKAELAALSAGTTVTIRGRCKGLRDDFVTLEECAIIPPGTRLPDTTPTSARVTIPSPTSAKATPTVPSPTSTKATTAAPTGPRPTAATPTGPKPDGGANGLKAADLAKAFADDATAADTKYKGKVVEVSGAVLRMDVSGREVWYVWYGKKDSEVECQFKKGAAGVIGLNPTNAATIRGKCAGVEDGVVILEDCTLVK